MEYGHAITVDHKLFGKIVWHVVDMPNADQYILMAEPIQIPWAFYDPSKHDHADYIHIKYGAGHDMDISNGNTEWYIKAPSSEERDKTNKQRYEDIKEYGSNQWVVSDIRIMLKHNFVFGLPDEFVKHMNWKTNDLILTRTQVQKKINGITERDIIGNGDYVYDEFKDGYRFTRSITTDRVFLPRADDAWFKKAILDTKIGFGKPNNYWLMDSAWEVNVPYLVKIVSTVRQRDGSIKLYSGNNNARYPAYICPVCLYSEGIGDISGLVSHR